MMTAIAITVWLSLIAARGTPIGNAMHLALVEVPARRLARIRRGDVLLMAALLTLIVLTIWLLENEGRVILAFGLPDIASLAVAVDLGTLLDVTLVAVAAASAGRVRTAVRWLRARTAPRRSRTRAIRPRRDTPPANDDEHRWAQAA